jgi:hypothetical protein
VAGIGGFRRQAGIIDQGLQNLDKRWAGGLQLLQVMKRESLEEFFAVVSQLDQDLPPVIGRPQAAKKPSIDQSIDKLNGAVMLQLHPFGQRPDSRFQTIGQTADGQQELVLLRLDAGLSRGVFTEAQKTTDLVAQFRHGFEVR